MIHLFHTALFCGAFWVVSGWFSPDFTEDRQLQAKRVHFSDHAAEYDAVFLGSSRIYRAFSSPVFNEHLPADNGLRVFNLAVGMMRPHELNATLEWVVSQPGAAPRVVFIELMDWSPVLHPGMENHDRTIAWNHLLETFSAYRTAWRQEADSSEDRRERWRVINACTVACLKHYTGFGQGVRWWRGRNLDAEAHLVKVMAYADGFVAFDQETGQSYQQRRTEFLERDLPIFHRQIAQIDQTNAQPGDLQHFNLQAQLQQQAWLERRGITVIYVLPNLRWGTPDLNQLRDRNLLHQVWTFNHPSSFPTLYAQEHYFDRGHLNRRGAEEFSRLMAERYLAWQRGSSDGGESKVGTD